MRPKTISIRRQLRLFKKLYSDFPYEQELNKVHAVRDVLAHNHLWEVSFSCDEKKGMVNNRSIKRSSGNKRYKQYVNSSTNLTGKLGLNVSSVKIGVSDAKTVTQAVWNILFMQQPAQRKSGWIDNVYF